MIRGKQDPVAFLEDQSGFESRKRLVGVEEAAGDLARGQHLELGGSRRLVEFEVDLRVLPVKVPENAGEHGRHRKAREGGFHKSDPALGDRPQRGRHGVQRKKHRLDLLLKGTAGRGQFDAAAGPREKGYAERLLELRDLPA